MKWNTCRVIFPPQATGGECVSAALSAGGDGAVIWKVIVTDYVSDTSPDSGLPGVFRITDVHGGKIKNKKNGTSAVCKELLSYNKKLNGRRSSKHQRWLLLWCQTATHIQLCSRLLEREDTKQTWQCLWGNENNLAVYIMQLPAE